jgi:hypothetical protein
MMSVTRIVDKLQADWPFLASLGLIGCVEAPAWAIQSALQAHTQLSPAERMACQAHLPREIANLAFLQRYWTVTVVLAVLLAAVVLAHAGPLVHNSLQVGILVTVLSTILLPALAIGHGIARDYVAAKSLLAVMRSASVAR